MSERTQLGNRIVIAAMVVSVAAAGIAWTSMNPAASASRAQSAPTVALATNLDDVYPGQSATTAAFAKYDGIDGESVDDKHGKWIDVLSVDWGANKPGGGATGQARRRAAAVIEDLVIAMDYDKASPKIQEKCLSGAVIPKLEIELTDLFGESRATYLRMELKNVQCTSFEQSYPDSNAPRSLSVVGNNFEEIKVTYTEFDDAGNKKGNVEYSWNVERGAP